MKRRENRLREKIPLITAMTLLISLSACSFGRVVSIGSPLERKADNTICRGCHEKLSPFHHPVGPGEIKRCVPATSTEEFNCSFCHAPCSDQNRTKKKHSDTVNRSATLVTDDVCFKCHPMDNPTCRDEYKGTASHFLGDPTQPDTYDDRKPPLKTSPWPVTKLSSKYVGMNGKGMSCLSCHVFRKGPDSTLIAPFPYHLLAIAGEKYDLGKNEDDYLCTGCHGLDPFERLLHRSRSSHPLLTADSAAYVKNIIPPATLSQNGHLNCLIDKCISNVLSEA